MTREDKVKEIIEVASQIRLAVDEVENLIDQEVIQWAIDNKNQDDWALDILNLQKDMIACMKCIPSV